jgi:predicted nucleotidyltransferase
MSLALAQPQLDAIADACRQHQVLRMHLFGWLCATTSTPRSGLDLLVEFQPIEPVALVMADAVRSPYVRRDIEASKQLIYEA